MKVRLAEGKLYYYDPVSSVGLSYPNNMQADVDETAVNVANLRYAIRTKMLIEVMPKPKRVEAKEEVVKTEPVEEVVEALPQEEVAEELLQEETVEEPPAPKTRGRRKKK